MITVKDFQIKTIQDLVEKELFKILDEGDFPFQHSITLKSSYSCYCDEIIKELEKRGFTKIRAHKDSYWITFDFDVDMEKKEEKKEEKKSDVTFIKCCPVLNGIRFCEKQNESNYSSINEYFDKHRQCNQEETEELIKNRFAEIDEQFKHGKQASIIFSNDFLNNLKPDENGIHYDIHWYLIMKVLQKRYGYVTMKRLDKDFNSVEEYIESHSRVEVIQYCPKICYFKFFIYKREQDYKVRDWKNGSVLRLEDLER